MRALKRAVLCQLPSGDFEAEVLPEPASGKGCGADGTCAGCTSCAAGMATPGLGLRVPLADVYGHKAGEIVKIWLRVPSQTVSSLVMMGLPLLLAIVGGVLGNNLISESWLVVGGIAGLVLGFAGVYFLAKTVLKVSAVLADEE